MEERIGEQVEVGGGIENRLKGMDGGEGDDQTERRG